MKEMQEQRDAYRKESLRKRAIIYFFPMFTSTAAYEYLRSMSDEELMEYCKENYVKVGLANAASMFRKVKRSFSTFNKEAIIESYKDLLEEN